MRHVTQPDLNALPSLEQIDLSLNAANQPAMAAIRSSIEAAYQAFEATIPDGLHQLSSIGLRPDDRKMLEAIFSRRLGAFRQLWDGLVTHFAATDNSTCPYCNFGEQWEYDHFLPKSVFPEFTLYPKNLIPICKSCNGKKLAKFQSAGERLFIYAFSELDGVGEVLKVAITYGAAIGITYSLTNAGGLQPATYQVLERHFSMLDLARRYSRQAATTVAHLVRSFRTPESLGFGPVRLRQRLNQMAMDRAASCPPNHWEAALLQELASTQDFVDYVFR